MQNDVTDDIRRMLTWHDLDADMDTLHAERICLNDP
jgi:hypothetical protein